MSEEYDKWIEEYEVRKKEIEEWIAETDRLPIEQEKAVANGDSEGV